MQVHPAIPAVGALLLGGAALARVLSRDDRIADRITDAYAWATPALADRIVDVADVVDADPYTLANLINLESGGDPRAVNGVTGATGLIQFIPSTARSLGTSTAAIAQMSALQQMDLVERYLERARDGRSLQAPHKLAMSVFYPAAMRWPSWTFFPLDVIRANRWKIFTPGDYVERMANNSNLPTTTGMLS